MSKIKIFSLGGLNENGKNMYVVKVDEDIFVFDAGLKYATDDMLGVDYIIPNYDYLKENEKRIKGIFLTNGYDEMVGAIPDILADLSHVKVYGTSFTLELLRNELEENGISTDNLVQIKPHHKINFGKTSILPISLTNSIPDSVGYALNTKDGVIFYTGNFVFDPTQSGIYGTDIGTLAYIGKQNVLCLMSESMYSDKPGFTAPNHRLLNNLSEAIEKSEGRIICNVFSNQIYRMQELFNVIMNTDRKVLVLGKRLSLAINKAIDMNYVTFDKKRFVSIRQANLSDVVILVSDEREKPFSNMARIVKGYDKFVKLNSSDTVVFLSPVYDGMEKSATKIFDAIARIDCNLITFPTKKFLEHHASREDIMMMLNLMKPKYYLPVIGEYRHLVENGKCAKNIGLNEENIILNLNGDVVTFKDGLLEDAKDKIKIDDILIDGKQSGDVGELVLKDRELLSDNGIFVVCTTLDHTTKKILSGPAILTKGFIYVKDNLELVEESKKIATTIIKENTKENFIDFTKVKNGIREKLGKYLYSETECKPMILVVIQEI